MADVGRRGRGRQTATLGGGAAQARGRKAQVRGGQGRPQRVPQLARAHRQAPVLHEPRHHAHAALRQTLQEQDLHDCPVLSPEHLHGLLFALHFRLPPRQNHRRLIPIDSSFPYFIDFAVFYRFE